MASPITIAPAFFFALSLSVLALLPASDGNAAGVGTAPPKTNSDSETDPRAAQALLERAKLLIRNGAAAEGTKVLDQGLSQFPRDVQLRFLRAVVHTDAGERAQALKMLESLTQDFPELPEPYNNLAVLYAQTGDYASAKRALETAIRVLPSYNLAQQNLGEVYLQLAAQAFENAAKVTSGNAGISRPGQPSIPEAVRTEAAVKRLNLVRELLKQLEK